MPSAAHRSRRVNVRRGRVLSKSVTPHTIAVNRRFLFVMGRNATDNFIVRLPMAAVFEILGIPKGHRFDERVLDIDPLTTEYTYRGQYPKFLDDVDELAAEVNEEFDGFGSTEEEED